MASKATIDSDVTLASDLSTLLATSIDDDTYADVLNMSITSTGYTAGQSDERVTEEWGMTVNAAIRAMWPQAKLVYDNFTDSGSAVDCDAPFTASTLTSDAQVVAGTYLDAGGGRIYSNAGTPEGSVTAPTGAWCLDITNGNLYFKASGSGNTGWTGVTSRQGFFQSAFFNNGGTGTYYFQWGDGDEQTVTSANRARLWMPYSGVIQRMLLTCGDSLNSDWAILVDGSTEQSATSASFTGGTPSQVLGSEISFSANSYISVRVSPDSTTAFGNWTCSLVGYFTP